jgi:16S rRNA (adenine1518-N6/adenine1519-N6)-dimethyltransferase
MPEQPSFKTKKSLGQHFLTSNIVPGWMADAANIEPGDTVLEIGPGTGMLTRTLLERGARVIALEADTRAIAVLNETFTEAIADSALTIYHADARKIDLPAIGLADHGYKVVANIPYYLSGHLFRTLLESSEQPATLVFLVQKEVATRIARDQKESLLSLSVKVYGTPKYVRTVSRGHFNPPPAVDSAIIAVHDISRNKLPEEQRGRFFELLHVGFGSKRKQLLGNLSKEYDRDILANIFSTLSIPLDIRAEDLSLDMWLKLTHALTVNH